MAQSIEEQLAIIKAYAEGKPVYMRSNYRNIGTQVEEKGHLFNFESSVYSLTPLDWCTGKSAINAYRSFMSEHDDAPSSFGVTLTCKDRLSGHENDYVRSCVNRYDIFTVFIAGAEWVLRNQDKGIDYDKSLAELREKCIEFQQEKRHEEDVALSRL